MGIGETACRPRYRPGGGECAALRNVEPSSRTGGPGGIIAPPQGSRMLSRELESTIRRILDGPATGWDAGLEALCRSHSQAAAEIRAHAAAVQREARTSATMPPPTASAIRATTQIGPYRILDTLGEGGMGTVYLAEQHTPVKRRIALKLIKLGMDSK